MAFYIWISPATAFDQAIRLSVDSGIVFRGLAELERSVVALEDSGWNVVGPGGLAPSVPRCRRSFSSSGANLLSSCPAGGVLLVGSDLEALSVWYDDLDLRTREILPIRPDRYATDSIYRRRMAEAMGIDPGLPVRNALEDVADRRTLCLTPTADSAAAPTLEWRPFRLSPGQPSRPARPRGSFGDGAAGGDPAGRLGLGARCPGGVRPRRAVQ